MIIGSHILRVFFLLSIAAVFIGSGATSYAQYPGFDAPGTRVSGGGAVGLVPVAPNVDGGSVQMGSTSQVVVLFRNDGAQPVQTGKINLYPSSNVSADVSLNQCEGEPLAAGAECAVALSVKGLQSGAWRLEMLMLHSGRSRLVTTTISGSVEASGDSANKLSSDIETIPAEINFGSLNASQSMVEPVILRNITSNPIKISEIALNASESAGYSVTYECDELQAGQACMAMVTWAPKIKGPSTGVLVVKHSGSSRVTSVSLAGEFTPTDVSEAQIFPDAVSGKGLLVSSQAEVDFGASVTSASTITVSLVNTGDSSLTIKDIKVSGSNNGLAVNAGGCASALVLEPIEACPLTLTWSPTRVGALLDDVQISHDGARGILILPVRGEAQSTVSQDQKTIVLSQEEDPVREPTEVIGSDDVLSSPNNNAQRSSNNNASMSGGLMVNAASALDGLRITSFAKTRAIVSGPGGSRLVMNGQPVMLGGVVWDVRIQQNGIEFSNGADRILLLFDRSLSSINQVSGQSSTTTPVASSEPVN